MARIRQSTETLTIPDASLMMLLLLLISPTTLHGFRPRMQPKQGSIWSPLDPSIPRRCRRQHVDFFVDFFLPWSYRIRGGADMVYLHETERRANAESSLAPLPNSISATGSSTNCTHTSDIVSVQKSDGRIQTAGDNEMVYATIGILNVPITHGENMMLQLCYKCDDEPECQVNESWGLHEARKIETIPQNGNDANYLALAETTGCLCDGIIIILPMQTFNSAVDPFNSDSAKHLDDVLLCLAEGIIRRLSGGQKTTLSLSIIFEGVGFNHVDDFVKEHATNYIRGYLERALHHVGMSHFPNMSGMYQTVDDSPILQQCNFFVSVSATSSLETARKLAARILEKTPVHAVSNPIVVPRSLFGAFCKQVYNKAFIKWTSLGSHHNEVLAEWKNSSEDKITTEILSKEEVSNTRAEVDTTESLQRSSSHSISTHLRQMVESTVAMTILDAEERLLDLENKMDKAFLDASGDDSIENYPMPEFATCVDAIISAILAPFLVLLDENKAVLEPHREWVKAQRTQVIKQVAENGIWRLFHLYLQNLRDHFGRCYESIFENILRDDFGTEGYLSLGDRFAWKLLSQKATKQVEERFKQAAFGSIPQIFQHPGDLCHEFLGMFSCEEVLRELLEDMHEVTLARGLEEEDWKIIMAANTEDSYDATLKCRVGLREFIKNIEAKIKNPCLVKWYNQLGLKVLVISVNYVQGWIVLQALRREARKRDIAMPKFPLL